jgi:hypothetical protein
MRCGGLVIKIDGYRINDQDLTIWRGIQNFYFHSPFPNISVALKQLENEISHPFPMSSTFPVCLLAVAYT